MGLTHIDKDGNAVMVDVSQKQVTERQATACGFIKMNEQCFRTILEKTNKKGDVLAVAQTAGIMAAKQTANLIPLCHNLLLTSSKILFQLDEEKNTVGVNCTVTCSGQTGVEMEALTGASVALLTIYDMCKAVDKKMVINNVHLVEKTGGKSGTFRFE